MSENNNLGSPSKNFRNKQKRYLFNPTVPEGKLNRRPIDSMAGPKYLAMAKRMSEEIDKIESSNTKAVIKGLDTRY